MKSKKSAGILLYRVKNEAFEIFLVHPGGPFWQKKDFGAWSIPKGEFSDEEDALTAAIRELKEETNIVADGKMIELKPALQKSGKVVYAWAMEKDTDASVISSNYFEMEWPPKSKRMQQFPEVDKAAWFSAEEAREKIIPGQVKFIEELQTLLK